MYEYVVSFLSTRHASLRQFLVISGQDTMLNSMSHYWDIYSWGNPFTQSRPHFGALAQKVVHVPTALALKSYFGTHVSQVLMITELSPLKLLDITFYYSIQYAHCTTSFERQLNYYKILLQFIKDKIYCNKANMSKYGIFAKTEVFLKIFVMMK